MLTETAKMKDSHRIFASLRILGRFSYLDHKTKLIVWTETLGCYLNQMLVLLNLPQYPFSTYLPSNFVGCQAGLSCCTNKHFLEKMKIKRHYYAQCWRLVKVRTQTVSCPSCESPWYLLTCVDVPFPDPKLSYCKPLPLYKPIFYFFNVT